jgi:hypothetical protein
MKRLLFSAVLFLLTLPAFARDLSLGEVRTRYLSQKVIILPSVVSSWKEGDLLDGNYSVGRGHIDSKDVIGQTGTVVSIEDRLFRDHDVDAFGRPISADKIVNSTLNIVVKLDNGMLIGTSILADLIDKYTFKLVADAEKQEKQLGARLDKLLNKTLYKTGYSRLFPGTLSLDEAATKADHTLQGDYSVENLTPMRVVQAKFVHDRGILLMQVELPNKETRLLVGDVTNVRDKPEFRGETETSMLDISAELSIPAKFTKQERAAIKKHEIYVGMSEDALWWSWGFPDKSNDWGIGGEQHVYHKHLYVYVKDKTVRNWQELSD